MSDAKNTAKAFFFFTASAAASSPRLKAPPDGPYRKVRKAYRSRRDQLLFQLPVHFVRDLTFKGALYAAVFPRLFQALGIPADIRAAPRRLTGGIKRYNAVRRAHNANQLALLPPLATAGAHPLRYMLFSHKVLLLTVG